MQSKCKPQPLWIVVFMLTYRRRQVLHLMSLPASVNRIASIGPGFHTSSSSRSGSTFTMGIVYDAKQFERHFCLATSAIKPFLFFSIGFFFLIYNRCLLITQWSWGFYYVVINKINFKIFNHSWMVDQANST